MCTVYPAGFDDARKDMLKLMDALNQLDRQTLVSCLAYDSFYTRFWFGIVFTKLCDTYSICSNLQGILT